MAKYKINTNTQTKTRNWN